MGGAASIDFSNFHNLSKQDVARHVASLGKDYENYAHCFVEKGTSFPLFLYLWILLNMKTTFFCLSRY